jgi:hypothetical protein
VYLSAQQQRYSLNCLCWWQGEGAKGLARGLTANATLHTLNLAWNGLENQGGGALGEMLSANMGLRKLDLSHARLGSEACLLLAEGLKVTAGGLGQLPGTLSVQSWLHHDYGLYHDSV